MIGYLEGVNNIIIITNEGERIKRKLGVKGINKIGKNYCYYDTALLLHIIDMKYVKTIKLYNDKTNVIII